MLILQRTWLSPRFGLVSRTSEARSERLLIEWDRSGTGVRYAGGISHFTDRPIHKRLAGVIIPLAGVSRASDRNHTHELERGQFCVANDYAGCALARNVE